VLRSGAVKDTAEQTKFYPMSYYLYILRSQKDKTKLYIGSTHDLEFRIKEHNQGKSQYSKIYTPWELEVFISFKTRDLAQSFERYLKSGSGHAFLKKRFLPK